MCRVCRSPSATTRPSPCGMYPVWRTYSQDRPNASPIRTGGRGSSSFGPHYRATVRSLLRFSPNSPILRTGNASRGFGLGYRHCIIRSDRITQWSSSCRVWPLSRKFSARVISFPQIGWLDSMLGGHSSEEAPRIVQAFLTGLPPDYPVRLRGKILQSADMLFRSARIASGGS